MHSIYCGFIFMLFIICLVNMFLSFVWKVRMRKVLGLRHNCNCELPMLQGHSFSLREVMGVLGKLVQSRHENASVGNWKII